MSGHDAIKFLCIHFLETWKDVIDEDTYDTASTIISNTDSKKNY